MTNSLCRERGGGGGGGDGSVVVAAVWAGLHSAHNAITNTTVLSY